MVRHNHRAATLPIESVVVQAFEIPTDGPDGMETDGTFAWSSTTIVVVELHGGGISGLGYTYGDASIAQFIESNLFQVLTGAEAWQPPALWESMHAAIRNAGQPGLGMMAISAADIAAWDLKAKALSAPLARVLPAYHTEVPIYGSGGFTNYPLDRLAAQLGGWAAQGIPRVKLKTSRHPDEDPERLSVVRKSVDDATEIFVDANGALGRRDAGYWAERFSVEWDVRWFEEPVSSQDIAGLRQVRRNRPTRIEIAAGEYGYGIADFAALIDGDAVDCLQADVTRCGGITGLLQISGIASAHNCDISAHCAPAVSAHAFCAVRNLRHLEYFHDHVRIETLLFDGTLSPVRGALTPDPSKPGLGLALRDSESERFLIHRSQN